MVIRGKKNIHNTSRGQAGFTIMEIVVATTLFAFTSVALTSLFNYTLKINRRAEALRQATQGMRDFAETIVKAVRNGQIDYGVSSGGQTVQAPVSPCSSPTNSTEGSLAANTSLVNPVRNNVNSSYASGADNRLGIIDTNRTRMCYYLGDANGNYIGAGAYKTGSTLVLVKQGGTPQIMNPPNYTINFLQFIVRPICDPYVRTCADYSNQAPKIQPMVSILIGFTVKLPTGETKTISYQTSVSTDKYDVPNTP